MSTSSSGDSRFWIAPVVVIAGCVIAGVTAGAVVFSATSPEVRLVPWLSDSLFAAALLVPLTGGTAGNVWLLRRWRRARPEGRRRHRVLVAIAIALGALGGSLLGGGLYLNKMLFEHGASAESSSPAGARAYLTEWGFMCGFDLWKQAPGELVMRRVDKFSAECGTSARIEWNGETPSIVGGTPSQPWGLGVVH